MVPPQVYHKLLEVTDNLAESDLQTVILPNTSELALKFGRIITNQHKMALNQMTNLLNPHHLANDDMHGASFQNIKSLSTKHRTVVRPRVVSDLRSTYRPPELQKDKRHSVQSYGLLTADSST